MRVLAIMLLLLASNLAAQSRYEVACREDVFCLSLQNLIQLEGEINDKKNPKIVEITNEIGLSRGSAYCQATQYYTFSQACKSLKLDKKHNPIPRNGLAQSSFNVAAKDGKQTKYEPAVGDLIIWKKGKTGFGHIGRVVELRKMGWVLTVEGNTSNGKGSNGIFYKKRNINTPLSRILLVKGLVGFNRHSQ